MQLKLSSTEDKDYLQCLHENVVWQLLIEHQSQLLTNFYIMSMTLKLEGHFKIAEWNLFSWLFEVHNITQVFSCWLPTMAAWVQSQVRSCGICGEVALA
jgi:acyl-[acyl carrier protein]--UDP-N-acetylglucosamine O-acyltransferase